MEWLTQTIITLNPLSLGILIIAGIALGWTIYALRGYKYWLRRFHHYHLPSRQGSRRARRIIQQNHGYLEYIPEVVNNPPKIRKPLPIKRPAQIIHKTPSAKVVALVNIPTSPVAESNNDLIYSTKDDLQVIEGIGPKIQEILNNNGVYTWRELAQTPENNLSAMLDRAGKQFSMHDPKSWPKQAHMADTSQWNELKKYQEFLHAGRE
jgi:predicted flap endonuclease-1-like 5' DNA nuclease